MYQAAIVEPFYALICFGLTASVVLMIVMNCVMSTK
jgi:hypothetical protein